MENLKFNSSDDSQWMYQALILAKQAAMQGEVPIGAVVIHHNQIIGRGFNTPIKNNDPTAHAEIQAIRQAAEFFQNYRLPDTILYVTLEPCLMCLGAIQHARIARLVFGANDAKIGAVRTISHRILYTSGILAKECGQILKQFFLERR